jgi:hypothetical protein
MKGALLRAREAGAVSFSLNGSDLFSVCLRRDLIFASLSMGLGFGESKPEARNAISCLLPRVEPLAAGNRPRRRR